MSTSETGSSHEYQSVASHPDSQQNRILSLPLTRRRMLGLTIAAPSIIRSKFLNEPANVSASKLEIPAELPAALEDLQERRNIIVDTIKDVVEETNFDYQLSSTNIPDEPWELAQLQLLDISLENLPEHFYKPGEDGTLHITLMPDSVSPCKGVAECAGLEYENGLFPQVVFIDSYFDPSNAKRAKDSYLFLDHELTHRALRPYKHQPNPHIDVALGESFAVARQKPGGLIETLREVKTPIYQKVEDLKKEHGGNLEAAIEALDETEREQFEFFQTQEIGLGVGWYSLPTSEFPDEYAAVLSEAFVQGRDYFVRNYQQLFPQENGGEIVERLYNYMKEVHGREYSQLASLTSDTPTF